MSTYVDSKYSAAFCILLGSLSVAFSDVVSFSVLHSLPMFLIMYIIILFKLYYVDVGM